MPLRHSSKETRVKFPKTARPVPRRQCFRVAIVGGSGAGKTWLAERLRRGLGRPAALLSMDDFYRDRSHLSQKRRAKLNFDHPRAIDWACLERVLRAAREGAIVRVPRYDFATHSRRVEGRDFRFKRVLMVEGLWLMHCRALRRLFDFCIYIDAGATLRLSRRLVRDAAERGRTRKAVREQFWQTVQPMHERHVVPQARWANVRLTGRATARELEVLRQRLRSESGAAGSLPRG